MNEYLLTLMEVIRMIDYRGILIGIFCLFLMTLFHELGHYLWDVLITKVPSRFVIKRVHGLYAFAVEAELPIERISEVKENPKYFIFDRKMARFAGILSVLPALVFNILFPKYVLVFLIMEIIYILYSFYETFFYNQDNPWIELAMSEEK